MHDATYTAAVKQFTGLLDRAIAEGLEGAALVDRDGKTIGLAGALEEEEAMPLAALVMYRMKSADLAPRLFGGGVLTLTLDDREVAVAVARRQLFVVAVLGVAMAPTLPGSSAVEIVRDLRDAVAKALHDPDREVAYVSRPGGGDGGASPAEASLLEYGITVRGPRAEA